MKKKHIQTDFIKFLLEKYTDEQIQGQDEVETDEDIEDPEQDEEEPQHKRKRKSGKVNEFDDEIPDEESGENDEDIIDELLNEYIKLKRKNESNRIRSRRK